MIISVDLYNAKPAYLQIADAVRDAIAIGSLQTGDRLPPIRQTAISTRVNRNTVSRAYLELEHQGLVQARQGSGFYVTEHSARQERQKRRNIILNKVNELLTEARLCGLSTEHLVQLLQSESAGMTPERDNNEA
ncbi:MAG TPA: GntR family transcriptional regulator [Gammaproteobacteria bacterium]|nr:GntR family transcriptional regulator [Gammaproteobacteria bacterium]HIL98902.1 GntR family transcriptional regulator [Pseudomonadales bacterium]